VSRFFKENEMKLSMQIVSLFCATTLFGATQAADTHSPDQAYGNMLVTTGVYPLGSDPTRGMAPSANLKPTASVSTPAIASDCRTAEGKSKAGYLGATDMLPPC
jgi:hypothetical protein